MSGYGMSEGGGRQAEKQQGVTHHCRKQKALFVAFSATYFTSLCFALKVALQLIKSVYFAIFCFLLLNKAMFPQEKMF